MSVASAIWKSDGHCRENLLLGKEERAGQRYYKGFTSAHIETPSFIFGKVDVSRSAMPCQNGWRVAPHKESKAPPLQLSSYTADARRQAAERIGKTHGLCAPASRARLARGASALRSTPGQGLGRRGRDKVAGRGPQGRQGMPHERKCSSSHDRFCRRPLAAPVRHCHVHV